MTKHPQLQAFINEINSRKRKNIAFTYGDGHKANLSVNEDTVVVTTDNPRLAETLGKILHQILSGNPKGAIDKARNSIIL